MIRFDGKTHRRPHENPSVMNLAAYDNSGYRPGRSVWTRTAWFFAGLPLLRCTLIPFSGFRRVLLRCFGATVGTGVVIKPGVRVKYPWRLRIGAHSWIGEDVWLDNLGDIEIGSHVCLSQGAYLCTGSHDWSDPAFGLKVGSIRIGDCAWIGAKAVICPGAHLGEGSVACAASVVTLAIGAYEVHAGNPAVRRSFRRIAEKTMPHGQAAASSHGS